MEEFFHGLPIWANFLLFGVGIAAIDRGSKYLVESSVSISRKSGIPKVIIGATIVSVATTFPEFTVSLVATLLGHNQIAVGNIIGSCACNIGLVAGLGMMLMPADIYRRTTVEKGIIMIAAGLAAAAFAWSGELPRWGAALLLGGFAGYVVRMVAIARRSRTPSSEDGESGGSDMKRDMVIFVAGMAGVGLASVLLVNTGKEIARWMNIPELIIALTMVSLGTSLPELVTAIRSAIMRHSELGIGNVIGANILNLLWAFGTCAMINPLKFARQSYVLDCPFLLLLMVMLVLFVLARRKVGRLQGAALMVVYSVYIGMMVKYFGVAA